MKVTKALILALTLAVPLSPISLVTADELLIKSNIKAFNQGTAEYSQDMHDMTHSIPMEFKDVIVVPPNLNDVTRSTSEAADNENHVEARTLEISADVAYNIE